MAGCGWDWRLLRLTQILSAHCPSCPRRPWACIYLLPQVLEQRGLVVKHPLVVKRPQGNSHFTSHVQTNILHLPRFAPTDVGKGATMTVRLPACLPAVQLPLAARPAAPRRPFPCQQVQQQWQPPSQTHAPHAVWCAAPRLPHLQDGKSTAHGGAGGSASQEAALGDDEVAVLDDASHFRRICARLAACAGQQANETELKVGGWVDCCGA